MKKYLFILQLTFLGTANYAFAQSVFEMAIGGPGEETCAKILADGSQYILAGHTSSLGSGSYDICLVRTDNFGNALGNSIVGTFGEDLTLSATKTSNHQYILTGYTNSFGSEHPFAVKFDSLGNMLWSKYYSPFGWGEGIAAREDGSFFIAGYASNPTVDVLLIKCDSSGNVIWTKMFGDSLLNEGRAVTVTEDGGALLCGIEHVQAGGPTDVFVIKTDSFGNVLWSNRYATPDFLNWDLGYSIVQFGNDILIGCLSYNQAFNPNPNSPDGLVLRLDQSGQVKSAFAFGTSEYEEIRDVAFLSDGKFSFTGVSNYQSQGQTDLLFGIADTLGNLITSKLLGGSTFDHGLSVVPLNDREFLLGGYTQSFGQGTTDMYFIKTDTLITPSCNVIQSGIQAAAVVVTAFAVFDTATIQCTGLNAGYTVIHQPLTITSLCSTTGATERKFPVAVRAFPNPFNSETTIKIPGNSSGKIEVTLLDLAGRKIEELFLGRPSGGEFNLRIDGQKLAAGLFICNIKGDGINENIMLMKN
jgi:hypothetical protein